MNSVKSLVGVAVRGFEPYLVDNCVAPEELATDRVEQDLTRNPAILSVSKRRSNGPACNLHSSTWRQRLSFFSKECEIEDPIHNVTG
jgi:hypothetical protein